MAATEVLGLRAVRIPRGSDISSCMRMAVSLGSWQRSPDQLLMLLYALLRVVQLAA